MKRKFEGEMDEESGWSTPPPTKRMSMLHNTPKQWKEQRRRLLNLSKQKIKGILDVETNLRKSVLINNTYRKIKHELKYSSQSPDVATYTPRGVFASSRRRLMMSQSEWERERDVAAMELREDDIQSKTLSPPPKDLSQVLSDILGEDMDESCDQLSSEKTSTTEEMCMSSVTTETSTNPCTMDNNQPDSVPQQTEALNLSVRLRESCVVDYDRVTSCDKVSAPVEGVLIEPKGEETSDKTEVEMRETGETLGSENPEASLGSQDILERSLGSQSDLDGSDSKKGHPPNEEKKEVMDCESTPLDTSDIIRSHDSGHMTTGGLVGEINMVLKTTDTIEDFVISPRVSQWKKQEVGMPDRNLTSLTLFPMFDLPMLPCPSLHTSNLIPKLLHCPETAVCHSQRYSSPEVDDTRQCKTCYHGDDCRSLCSSTEGCEQTVVGGASPSDLDTRDLIRDDPTPCVDPIDTLGSSYDSDGNQQLWACFQQFNMVIACS